MPIQDSDLLLIENTSGVSKKIAASKLKANLAANTYNNYKLLVNKPDYSSRFVYAQNMQASVAPTDYMMVERAGVSYKVNGQQIIDYFPSVPAGAAGPITNVVDVDDNYEISPVPPSPNCFSFPPAFGASSASGMPLNAATTVWNFTGPWDMSTVTKVRGGGYDVGNPFNFTFINTAGVAQTRNFSTASTYSGFHDLSDVDFSLPIAQITIVTNPPGFFLGFFNAEDLGVAYVEGGKMIANLTLGSETNLELFVVGDSLGMVDSDGNLASYTPVTSTITNIAVLAIASIKNQDGTPYDITGNQANAYKFPEPGSNRNWTNAESATSAGTGYVTGATSNGFTQYEQANVLTITLTSPTPKSKVAYFRGGGYSPGDAFTVQINSDPVQNLVTKSSYAGDPDALVYPSEYVSTIRITSVSYINIVNFYGADQKVSNLEVFTLTFGTPNEDLKFIKPGDVIQSQPTAGGFDPDDISPATKLSNNDFTISGSAGGGARGKFGANILNGDKIYWEITFDNNLPSGNEMIGIATNFWTGASNQYAGGLNNNGVCKDSSNRVFGTGWNVREEVLSWSAGKTYGFACDAAAGMIWLSQDGAWIGAAPSAGGGAYFECTDPLLYTTFFAWVRGYDNNILSMSETPKYPVPDGFTFSDGSGVKETIAIAVDPPANTMSISGGKFLATDGTSSFYQWDQSSVWSNTTTNNGRTDFPPTFAFDGNLNKFCASGNYGEIAFTPPTPLSGKLEILANNIGESNGANTLRVFSDEGNISGAFYCKPHPEWTQCGQQTNITKITNTSTLSGNGSTIYAIKLNGEILVDSGLTPPTPATVVTGPAKSGTGNFKDNTGAVVDVSNSNEQWISNDNRLGEDFFIKAASTRTGLAILRTQAIKVAQAYDPAKAPYPIRSLVIYEGDYYVNAGVVRPGQDRWIDLGRTAGNA